MLYSPSQALALALFPKTAGSSLTTWFRAAFPDMRRANAGNPHIAVVPALETFGLLPKQPKHSRGLRRVLGWPFASRNAIRALPKELMIIGVVRDPFEMLVSLYAYWHRVGTPDKWNVGSLPYVAVTGTFHEFVELAVVGRRLSTYDEFFGVGSVAWPSVRLLDFNCLESGLRAACHEHGIEPPAIVPKANVAPSTHDYDARREEVTDLLPAIRKRYRWYYEEADRFLVRGDAAPPSRGAA